MGKRETAGTAFLIHAFAHSKGKGPALVARHDGNG